MEYTTHLIKLLPRPNVVDFVDVDEKIRLEYASLTKTFAGAIVLDEKPPVFVSGGSAVPKKNSKKKDTLQSIIDKVNERFSGNFTDADRVIIEGIYQMFMKDTDVKKFKKYAKDNSTEMFVKSLFPDFYHKVQEAMAAELYKALRRG